MAVVAHPQLFDPVVLSGVEPDVTLVDGVGFHPAVAAWFRERFVDGPTPAQLEAWQHIAAGEHKPQTGSHADSTRPSRIDELEQAPDVLVQKAESDGRKGFRVTVYNYGPGSARCCSVSATATRGQRSISHSARLEDEIGADESRSVTLRSAGVIGALDGYQFDVTCRNEPDELKGNNLLVF